MTRRFPFRSDVLTVRKHASILIDHGVLAERREGRHRYVQIASTDVADWLEHTGALAGGPMTAAPTLAAKTRDRRLMDARTCCRHIAGRFGIQLFSALTQREWIDESLTITDAGRAGLADAFGLDVGAPTPGDLDLKTIETITGRSWVPVLVSPRYSRSTLAEAGVGRISTGSLLYRAAMSEALRSLRILDDHRPAETANMLSYGAFTELGRVSVRPHPGGR
ncbi:hypothetical protein [Brevibacterium limosum]|uniref:hypothetical protein n=1 Tax=Brevibacterium limosum TaxID=2697565 RepID=UPI00142435B3|nr:hypothetical protein [Brevibacterium limosum]